MNARYYNPNTGRFISQDSYKGSAYEPWTQNLYTYCSNNPVNFIDPTGHMPEGFSGSATCQEDWDAYWASVADSAVEPENSGTDDSTDQGIPTEYYDGVSDNGIPIIDTWFTEVLDYNADYTQQAFFDETGKYNANMVIPSHNQFFRELVTDDALMDLKITYGFKQSTYVFNGQEVNAEDLGNINYGYIGASLDISTPALNFGSFWNARQKWRAETKGLENKEARSIVSDRRANEREDREMVKIGVELYNDK